MKRIVVEKNETAASVAHKLLGTMEREVVLVIPKQSKVGSSLNNLHLLHREAAKAKKNLTVESVDEEVLAFAKLAGIASSHPFLGRVSPLQDIVPRRRGAAKEKLISSPMEREVRVSAAEEREEEAKDDASIAKSVVRARTSGWGRPFRFGRRVRGFLIAVVVALLVIGGVWAVGAFFGKASVTVRLEEIPWQYQGVLTADAAAAKIDSIQRVLPAEIFSLNRNITQQFPATGSENTQEYARGTMVVYNSYSSTPQPLVATTRFVGQDGKVFRLADKVVVPGALVRNGAITPASTTAAVIADKPGAEYNIASITKLTIPAFRGGSKFGGFYGTIPGGTKGGYVGIKKVATAKDIEAGKARTEEILKASLEGLFATTKPEGFMVADGGVVVTVKKIAANAGTDASGNFNVFGEAALAAPGFREEDLRALLLGYAAADRAGRNLSFRSLSLEAKAGTFDAAARRAPVTVTARGVLASAFSAEDFKASIAGMGVRDAQAAIGRIQGLAEGKISVWPFWVERVPADTRRVTITVQ